MKWAEAFQAMSEGKTVAGESGVLYRVHNGVFQYKLQDGVWDWSRSSQSINEWINNKYELAIDYPLTFLEAMNEVQKGYKVECKESPGTVVKLNEDGDVIIPTIFGSWDAYFDARDVRGKWRVVEEEE